MTNTTRTDLPLTKTPLGRKVKELTWEHHDWYHVTLAEATYDDTLAVRSPYEGVLYQLVEDLEDAGYYVQRDSYDNALFDTDEPLGFEIIVCAHDEHPYFS